MGLISNKVKKQLLTIFENAVNESNIRDSDARCIIDENSTVFKNTTIETLEKLGIPRQNPFGSDITTQQSFYPEGWKMPDLKIQRQKMTMLFPGIDLSYINVAKTEKEASYADGIGIIPKLSYLGKLWALKTLTMLDIAKLFSAWLIVKNYY